MYNFGLQISIGENYKGIITKLKADTISECITKIATIYGVQSSEISIDKVAYVQEILTIPEE